MSNRKCADCSLRKDTEEFNSRTSRGITYKMSICRKCEKVRQQGYYRMRKLLQNLRRG